MLSVGKPSPPLRTRSSSSASERPTLYSMHNRSSSISSVLSIEPHCPTDDILTQKLSSSEIEVLKCTSNVNDKMFLPWIDETDLKEQFSYAKKYLDPEGSLRLSEKQMEKFGGWKRPADIMKYPKLICLISRYVVVQLDFLLVWSRVCNGWGSFSLQYKYYSRHCHGLLVCGIFMCSCCLRAKVQEAIDHILYIPTKQARPALL